MLRFLMAGGWGRRKTVVWDPVLTGILLLSAAVFKDLVLDLSCD